MSKNGRNHVDENKKKGWIAAILILCGVVFALAYGFILDRAEKTAHSQLRAAPSFALKDSAGVMHQLSDFRGQAVILHFWASWCPPCLDEIPNWVEFARRYSNQPIAFVAISLDPQWKDALKVLPSQGLPAQVVSLLDESGKTPEDYGTYQFPETYLLDYDHRILTKWVGPQNWNQSSVERWIDAAHFRELPAQTPQPGTSPLPPQSR